MNFQQVAIDPAQIEIHSEDIKLVLGAGLDLVDSYTEELIERCITKCCKSMAPQGGFQRMEALNTTVSGQIRVQGANFQTGKIIKNRLAGSKEYAFILATAGPGPESLSRRLLEKGEFLEGYIVDLVASALVESVANLVQDHIKEMTRTIGLNITNRYSPGYCKWDVSEQQKLFKLFPENCCGITLSDSSLMSPIKSLSAILGMGLSVVYQENTCEICSMKECIYRKTSIHSPE